MKKKVLIITLDIGENYGGILQAYALQKTLNDLGSSAVTTASFGIREIKYILFWPLRAAKRRVLHGIPTYTKASRTRETVKFIKNNIRQVSFYTAFTKSLLSHYSLYVTGSDQVWRKPYTNVKHNMFSFVRDKNSKIISYAASFGRGDFIEYDSKLVVETKKLAANFDSVSVRESDAVLMVDKSWGLKATQHVDPVFLLGREVYQKIANTDTETTPSNEPYIHTYILDSNSAAKKVISSVERTLGLPAIGLGSESDSSAKSYLSISDPSYKRLPSVESWISGFARSTFVVTDSFHGCVLSIIFNKPFIVLGNEERGLSRFTSLLDTFNLRNRLVLVAEDEVIDLTRSQIDWEQVNAILENEKKRSLEYLEKHLR